MKVGIVGNGKYILKELPNGPTTESLIKKLINNSKDIDMVVYQKGMKFIYLYKNFIMGESYSDNSEILSKMNFMKKRPVLFEFFTNGIISNVPYVEKMPIKFKFRLEANGEWDDGESIEDGIPYYEGIIETTTGEIFCEDSPLTLELIYEQVQYNLMHYFGISQKYLDEILEQLHDASAIDCTTLTITYLGKNKLKIDTKGNDSWQSVAAYVEDEQDYEEDEQDY